MSKLIKNNKQGDGRSGVFFDPPDEIAACRTCVLPDCCDKNPRCNLKILKDKKRAQAKAEREAKRRAREHAGAGSRSGHAPRAVGQADRTSRNHGIRGAE